MKSKFKTYIKLISLFLLIVLVLPNVIGSLVKADTQEVATASLDFTENTIYIDSEEDLRELATYVNAGNDCKGKEFIVTKNITISKNKWVPIGTYNNTDHTFIKFNGHFNGNGYTISGLTYADTTTVDNWDSLYVGLFGVIGSLGSVKNLTTSDFNINLININNGVNGYESGYTTAGNIAGINYGTIENCTNTSNIIGTEFPSNPLGGIVGTNEGNVITCRNTGKVEGVTTVGGIAGYSNEENKYKIIENCSNLGDISGAGDVGGIIGYIVGGVYENETTPPESQILNSYNTGNIIYDTELYWGDTYEGSGFGGIAGYAKNIKFYNVTHANGKVEGFYVTGGVLGAGNNILIDSALNSKGTVICEMRYGGGIVGSVTGTSKLSECGNYESELTVNGAIYPNCNIYGYTGDSTTIDEETCKSNINNIYVEINGGIGLGCQYGNLELYFGVNSNYKSTNYDYPTLKIENVKTIDEVTFTFTWSEQVNDFTAEDIVVTGGTKGTLSSAAKNSDGTYSYTMKVAVSPDAPRVKATVGNLMVTDTNGIYNRKSVESNANIDTTAPTIKSVTVDGRKITIIAEDDLSNVVYGIKKPDVAQTEWTDKNVIEVSKSGRYIIYVKDSRDNMNTKGEIAIVDITAPTINSVTVDGRKITIMAEDEFSSEISYGIKEAGGSTVKWQKSNVIEVTKDGRYNVLVKDSNGNEQVWTKSILIDTIEPEILFKDLITKEIDGTKYVKVTAGMTKEEITAKMDSEALDGETPTYSELTSEGKLKTGTKISLKGEVQFIVVVKGDTTGDGKVSPADITTANSIRLNKVTPTQAQKEAADFDSNGKINPLDLTMINSYRLGKI